MSNFKGLRVEIISSSGIVFDAYCHMATIPTTNGELGIMKNHESTLVKLKEGEVNVYNDKNEIIKTLKVLDGFAHNIKNKLLILIDK